MFRNLAGRALALIAPALRLDELCIQSLAQIRHTKGKWRTFLAALFYWNSRILAIFCVNSTQLKSFKCKFCFFV